jgi:hypothetical protein
MSLLTVDGTNRSGIFANRRESAPPPCTGGVLPMKIEIAVTTISRRQRRIGESSTSAPGTDRTGGAVVGAFAGCMFPPGCRLTVRQEYGNIEAKRIF